MKRLIEIEQSNNIDALLGVVVTLFCANYFYTGKLIAIDDMSVTIENPKIVYETGSFSDSDWKDAQPLPQKKWHVMLHAIESFGIMK